MSKSKRDRLWLAKVNAVDRMMSGATVDPEHEPVRWVDCRATGCRERLAEIRYERDDVIAFEVRAPVHDEDGVNVLERSAKADQPPRIARASGAVEIFRCPRCGRDTRVDLASLRAVRAALANRGGAV